MTIMELNKALEWGVEYLHKHGIEGAREEAEYLLFELLNCSKSDIYLKGDTSLSTDVFFSFSCFIRERARHVPRQYITGKAWFASLPFMVNGDVMVPRPETEILVETVIKKCRKRDALRKQTSSNKTDLHLLKIADVGTGCGNIAISLAKSISCEVYALDISCRAIDIARKNAEEFLVVNLITFICEDILNLDFELPGGLDLVISNPPYISHDDIKKLPMEVRGSEPHIALDGGKDGVEFYPPIVHLASDALSSGGYLALEVGIGQAEKVREIIFESESYERLETINDYAGIERVIVACRK